MKHIIVLLLLTFSITGWAQTDMEEQEFIKKGKIKTTYINYAGKHQTPDYQEFKRISEIRNVESKNGEVHNLEIYCEKSSTLKYSRLFVARGNINEDGSLDNVFGFYSEKADMWAIPFEGSIYIINASIRKATSAKDLVIPFVLGPSRASRAELFDYYKPIYLAYQKRVDSENAARYAANKAATEKREAPYRIADKDVVSLKILVSWQNKQKHSSNFFGTFTIFAVGVEATLSNGETIKTNNWSGGKGFLNDYEITTNTGVGYNKEERYKPYFVKPYNFPDDYVEITVKSKYHDLTVTKKLFLDYNEPVQIHYGGIIPFAADAHDGRDLLVKISETFLSRDNSKRLIEYNIHDAGSEEHLATIILEPNVELFVHNRGGRANPGYSNGNDGSFAIEVQGSFDDYNIKNDSRGGIQKSTIENKSDKITIVNKTGKSVCVAHYGGSKSIGNGSSETFSCRDIYYGIMEGANCTGKKGAKIADKEDDCGKTITLD